ncbi:MAG: STAS/SEC14 domain-containing protein [Rudaea sp.]
MLNVQPQDGTNILEFTIDGGFNRSEFDTVAARIEQMVALHGKIRVIEIIKSIGPIEPSAFWQDLKFAPKHMKDFSHVAVVGDQKWITWLSRMAKPFLSAKVRIFGLDEVEKARVWIKTA